MASSPVSSTLVKWKARLEKGVFTVQMDWDLVFTSDGTITDFNPTAVAGLFSLPVEGTSYVGYDSSRPLVSCRSVECEQIKGGVYSYKTTWSDENSKEDTQSTDEDPLNDLPIIKPVGGFRERAITQDRNDEAILNKAGDPVAQSVDDNTISLSVEVNVEPDGSTEALVLDLRNRVNAAPIQCGRWFAGTNMARVIFGSDFLSEVKRRNGIEYQVFKYELQIDERDLHKGVPLNAGFRQKVWGDPESPILAPTNPDPETDTFTLERILSSDGSEPSEPLPLDEFGRKLVDPQPDTVLYLDVLKYEEGDFTQLPGVSSWSP